MAEAPGSPGERLYLVRLACGDGLRKAEAMTEFVVRVARRTGENYHPNAVSLLERNQQKWRLVDVRAFAAVDPVDRGEIWLSALSSASTWPAQKPAKPVRDSVAEPVVDQRSGKKPKPTKRASGSE